MRRLPDVWERGHHKRHQVWRQRMREYWESNCGRALYRWIRNEKSAPTVALRVNCRPNSLFRLRMWQKFTVLLEKVRTVHLTSEFFS